MPRYEVTRSYTVACVATVEAESVDKAKRMAFESDMIWKEYDGDYHAEVDVEEIDNA